MSDTPTPEAGWYPDPSGRYQHRYWDGTAWTDNVSTNGNATTDTGWSLPANTSARDASHIPPGTDRPERVQRQVQRAGGGTGAPGSGLFDQPVLVVNQRAKLIELNNEYAVYDGEGTQVAAVRQVGQSAARKVLRALTSVDQFLTHRLQVTDAAGTVLLELTRPAKVFKSTVVVARPDAGEVGRIVQENMVGKIRFGLMAGDRRVGSINAENWRAWNFSIKDETETEVARITKTWEGVAKTMFTTADNYVVHVHRPLDEPLRSLVVASALSVDTALKQDSRGLG